MAAEPMILTEEQYVAALPAALKLGELHLAAQCLHAVVKLGVPDIIGTGSLTPGEIAAKLPEKVREEALVRCLRLLAAMGVFQEVACVSGGYRFRLTPTGALLQTGLPQPSMASGILHCTQQPVWGALAKLPDFVAGECGQPPFEAANGRPVFDFLRERPEASDHFHQFMSTVSATELPVVASGQYIDWKAMGRRTVVDVGGGLGLCMAAVAEQYPDLKCVSFDLPEVVDRALECPCSEQVKFVAGDMLRPGDIPKGDVVLLKHVLRHLGDPEALKVLEGCGAAVPAGGEVIVVDAILPDPGWAFTGTQALSHDMLAMVVGGKERTRGEWEALAKRAGLGIAKVTTTPQPLCQIITLAKS